MKLLFTPAAREQLLAAVAYLREEDPRAAAGFRERSARAFQRLEQFPGSGRVVPEFPDLPHREVIVSPYRFFYRAVDETVWIVAVWHERQLPRAPR